MQKASRRILGSLIFIFICTTLFLPGIPAADVQAQEEDEYLFVRSWGDEAQRLEHPTIVGVGPDNKIYVVNDGRMTVINQENQTYSVWLDYESSTTYNVTTSSIAFDSDGNILLTDFRNPDSVDFQAVSKYSPKGELILSFGEYGSGEGQLRRPNGIAVDLQDNIYVSDEYRDVIVKFSPDGNYLAELHPDTSSSGTAGLLDLDFDSKGNLYAVDSSNNCIQKFNKDGVLLYTFGNDFLLDPKGISIDGDGKVYVSDVYINTIEIFDSSGNHIGRFSEVHNESSEPGEFYYPNDVFIDSKGNVFVADTLNDRVQKLDSNGNYIISWGLQTDGEGIFDTPTGVILDGDGNLLIGDGKNRRILKYTIYGTYLSYYDIPGTSETSFFFDFDNDQNLYVSDYVSCALHKINSNGEVEISIFGAYDELFYPTGILVHPIDGLIYVVDSVHERIVVYDDELNFQREWGEEGTGFGQFRNPGGIAADNNGRIYVADEWNDRIQLFTSEGIFIEEWTGYFSNPYDIYIENDSVYITDIGLKKILVFDLDGNLITQWGDNGLHEGEIRNPCQITTDSSGNFFISDFQHRIQVFRKDRLPIDGFSGLIQNGSFASGNTGWALGGNQISYTIVNRTGIEEQLQLGDIVTQTDQGISEAWAHQTIYVDPTWTRPVLTFDYNMNVNDIIHYSDFFVEIQDGVGLNHLQTVIRDGYQPCTPGIAPPEGTDLGWRKVNVDLSAYKGQYIRIVFHNRNLWPISWGIWTYVDNVRVLDAGPLPPFSSFIPLLNSDYCDLLTSRSRETGDEGYLRP